MFPQPSALLALLCLLKEPVSAQTNQNHAVVQVSPPANADFDQRAPPSPARRPTILLDESPLWQLELDPADPQTQKLKADGQKTAGPVKVPGSWQASGFGGETDRMFHQYIGAANYTLSQAVDLPIVLSGNATPPGMKYYLNIEHALRSVRVICAGKELGFLRGFLERLEVDATECLRGTTAEGGRSSGSIPSLRPMELFASKALNNRVKRSMLRLRCTTN